MDGCSCVCHGVSIADELAMNLSGELMQESCEHCQPETYESEECRTPIEKLKDRLASGDIDLDEYRAIKDEIES